MSIMVSCTGQKGGAGHARAAQVVEKAVAKLTHTKTFSFKSQVALSGAGESTRAHIEGDVVSAEPTPDVRATLTGGPQGTELLRRSGKTWVKIEDGSWEPKSEIPPQLQTFAVQGPGVMLKKLANLSAKQLSDGWLVEGTADPKVIGVQGSAGRIKVLIKLDKEHRLQRLQVPAVPIRLAESTQKLHLETATDFFGFDTPLNLPDPPRA